MTQPQDGRVSRIGKDPGATYHIQVGETTVWLFPRNYRGINGARVQIFWNDPDKEVPKDLTASAESLKSMGCPDAYKSRTKIVDLDVDKLDDLELALDNPDSEIWQSKGREIRQECIGDLRIAVRRIVRRYHVNMRRAKTI